MGEVQVNEYFIVNIAIILVSGFIAGTICKYLKASPLIGYLLVGALIGPGCLDLTNVREYERTLESVEQSVVLEEKTRQNSEEALEKRSHNRAEAISNRFERPSTLAQENVELRRELATVERELAEQRGRTTRPADSVDNENAEQLARMREGRYALESATEFGVLLLLFSIGIEFTFAQLAATAKYMFVGGAIQMGLTIGVGILVCILFKMNWIAGLAIGSVLALSSTALVYKSLGDLGQADTKRAQATLGLLIFQDIALVPLLLILPIVLGSGAEKEADWGFSNPWIDMTFKSILFCAVVLLLKFGNRTIVTPRLAALRSNDLVILYAIVILLLMCILAEALGLTGALGALAAGVILGENRLTHQIDALVLPFREAFSSMFFISLGMLTDFAYVFHRPLVCLLTLVGAVAFKACCATLALRICGMDRRGARAYGICISQIGELAFMILSVAYAAGALKEGAYNTMLFVSVASLVLTPNLVKFAITKTGMPEEVADASKSDEDISPELIRAITNSEGHGIVVGAGPIGQTLANALLKAKRSVCVVDFNPVNLQSYSQDNVPTVAGDGADHEVLRKAGIGRARLVFVTTPNDDLTINVVRSARALNPTAEIVARTRYRINVAPLQRAGAGFVLCEENAIAEDMLKLIEDNVGGAPVPASV